MIPVGYCQCGCGTALQPRRFWSKGVRPGDMPRYVTGHRHRYPDWPFELQPAPDGLDPALGPCWIWKLGRDRAGYGKITVDCKSLRAHRRLYEVHVGPIPDGLVPDHLCARPACVNYSHLEPVTVAVNSQRGRNAKLTPEQVREIFIAPRRRRTLFELAAKYGVGRRTICFIRRGLIWKNVTAGLARVEQCRTCPACGASIAKSLGRRTCNDQCLHAARRRAIKLTASKAEEIRARRHAGQTHAAIALEFGVSSSLVGLICAGRVWQPEARA